MAEDSASKSSIPVLTDIVNETASGENGSDPRAVETLIAELQTELSASAFALTEQVLRAAFTEMEAALLEQITARLRQELPELVDRVLREQLAGDEEL
jgi:hypothetical protein